jgi:tetratricopeptide (TPR) repeat protein
MPQHPKVLEYTLAMEDFDQSLLPPEARDPTSPSFREAVKAYLEGEFRRFGGWYDVQVDEHKIRVRWTPDRQPPDVLDQVVAKLQRGETAGAIILLELFLADQPSSLPILYNLGMALSDAGRLDEAERHLHRALEIEPGFTNARVALGVALHRRGKTAEAISALA